MADTIDKMTIRGLDADSIEQCKALVHQQTANKAIRAVVGMYPDMVRDRDASRARIMELDGLAQTVGETRTRVAMLEAQLIEARADHAEALDALAQR